MVLYSTIEVLLCLELSNSSLSYKGERGKGNITKRVRTETNRMGALKNVLAMCSLSIQCRIDL